MKILFLEPSKVYQQVITKAMSSLDVDIVITTSPETVLEMAEQTHFDMVCVPLYLDNTTGPEIAKKLRASPKSISLPIILLTTSNDSNIQKECLDAGITDFFPKSDMASFANYVYLQQSRKSIDTTMIGHMLFVGDGSPNSNGLAELFEEAGMTVSMSKEQNHALELLSNDMHELVAIYNPEATDISGLELVHRIRERHPAKQEKPVIAILPTDSSELRLELLKNGANDVVANGIAHEEILIRGNNLTLGFRIQNRLKEQQRHLESIVMNDPVTSLYNKHCLLEMAPKFISEAIRYRMQIGMLLIEIDNYERLLAERNKQITDVILIEIANLLKSNCRNEDLIARVDERSFVIMLSHCNHELSVHKSRQLSASIQKLKPEGAAITASIGIASLEEEMRQNDSIPFETFYKIAENAIANGKKKGNNQITEGHLADLMNTD